MIASVDILENSAHKQKYFVKIFQSIFNEKESNTWVTKWSNTQKIKANVINHMLRRGKKSSRLPVFHDGYSFTDPVDIAQKSWMIFFKY